MKKKNLVILVVSLFWILFIMACGCDLGSLLNKINPSPDPWGEAGNGNSIPTHSNKTIVTPTENVLIPTDDSIQILSTLVPDLETQTPNDPSGLIDLPTPPDGYAWKSLPE